MEPTYLVPRLTEAKIGLAIIALRQECEKRGYLEIGKFSDFSKKFESLVFTCLPVKQALEQTLEHFGAPTEEWSELVKVFEEAAYPPED